jgi:GNAT superfamily N-acetyltransferase
MEDREWLKSMFRKELDLRPPTLARIGENSIFIRDDSGQPIAHATLSRRGGGIEINSVVVDPQHRGQGLSKELLRLAGQSKRRLFAYTKDPRMKSTLLQAGYSPARSPGFRPSLNLMVTRPAIFLWMILTLDVKRVVHITRHMFAYKLYIRR